MSILRGKGKVAVSALLLVSLFVSLISASLAWFANLFPNIEEEFSASSLVSYFAGGEGKQDNPYIIRDPVHLYNLSWLQNAGYFKQEPDVKEYFKVSDTNGNPVVIDMAGQMSGDQGHTGAIPPIGTMGDATRPANPFLGELDGNGSTIKNLWVSTLQDDWYETPENHQDDYYGTHVGLFGAMGGTAVVENLFLDRVEIKTHIDDSTVGLLCGYLDAKISNVGVCNGIITTTGLKKCHTRFTLLGDISPDVKWDGPGIDGSVHTDFDSVPGGIGGELIVNPAVENERTGFKPLPEQVTVGGETVTNNTRPVPGSIPGVAFYSGTLNSIECNNFNIMYDFTSTATGDRKITDSYVNGITNNDAKKKRLTDILDQARILRDEMSKRRMIAMTQAPFAAGSTIPRGYYMATFTGENGTAETVKIPTDGIWFRPRATGTAALLFIKTDNDKKSPRYMMIYKMQRDDKGNTNPEDDTLSLDSTFEYELPTTIKNYDMAYYELEIEEGFEYIIGWSNVSGHTMEDKPNTCGFLYLRLAGANIAQGAMPGTGTGEPIDGVETKVVLNIDYLTRAEINGGLPTKNGIPQISFTSDAENPGTARSVHQSLLCFYAETASGTINGSAYYTAVKPGEGESKVHYYTTTASIPVKEFAVDKKSEKDTTTGNFLRRTDTASGGDIPLT